MKHNLIVTHLASSLNTPHLPSKKVAIELLTFMCVWEDAATHHLVVAGLEALSVANNMKGPFEYWFSSLESTLAGRGKMGSLVGASEDIRKNNGMDSTLNEYAVSATITPSYTPPLTTLSSNSNST